MSFQVTTVITTYRRRPEIVRRALNSIVNQTYNSLEIIVVNDAPEEHKLVEELRELCSELNTKKNIKYVVMEKNSGACAARNKAIELACGDCIAFLDDDDEWLPKKIELQVKELEDNPKCALVYCNSILYFEGKEKKEKMFSDMMPMGYIYKNLMAENIIGSCSYPLFRMSCLREIGGFREDMPALQDWELYLRLLQYHEARYVHEPLAVYHFYEGERISGNTSKRTEAYEKIRIELQDDLEKERKTASDFFIKGCYFYSLNNEPFKAVQYYYKSVINNPLRFKRNILEALKIIKRIFIKPKIY